MKVLVLLVVALASCTPLDDTHVNKASPAENTGEFLAESSKKKDSNIIPQPYSTEGPPAPDNAGTYGDKGPYSNGWNGQYYPYASYGYGEILTVGPFLSPFYLAGPYGFYGPFGPSSTLNATVSGLYVNGSASTNSTWVNGTYFNSSFENGIYTIYATPGTYQFGVADVYADSNRTLNDPTYGFVVNGTFVSALSEAHSTVINPNITANGTVLHANNNTLSSASINARKSSSGENVAATRVAWKSAALVFGAAALFL